MHIQNKKKKNHLSSRRGSTLMELIIVVVLFVILIPAALSIFLSARRVGGQAYVQNEAARTLGETADILRFMRNRGFDLLTNGEFYLIRNPGSDSWLIKSDVPNEDIFRRRVVISNALRHEATHQLYLPGDSGLSYEDPDTKKVDITVTWSTDYLPQDSLQHTLYVSNWQKTIVHE